MEKPTQALQANPLAQERPKLGSLESRGRTKSVERPLQEACNQPLPGPFWVNGHPHWPKHTWRVILGMAKGMEWAKAEIRAVRNEGAKSRNTPSSSGPSSAPSPQLHRPSPRSQPHPWVFSEATGPQGGCSSHCRLHSSFHRPKIRSTAPSRKASKGEINWTAQHESHR